MKLIKRMILVLTVMGLGTGLSFAAQDNLPLGKTIKVEGQGAITAEPDQVIIQISVIEEGVSVEDLVAKVKTKMARILTALKSFDIPKKDLQTTQYSIEPKNEFANGKSQRVGYVVNNSLKIDLKKISKIGDVLAALSTNDTAQLNGLTFGFSEPAKLQEDALKLAVEDAHAKAMVIANEAGVELGPVYSIEQKGVNMPTIRPLGETQGGIHLDMLSSVQVEPGTDQVTAQVEVVYTLK
jgi:uncharacterized protein YggE